MADEPLSEEGVALAVSYVAEVAERVSVAVVSHTPVLEFVRTLRQSLRELEEELTGSPAVETIDLSEGAAG